MSRKRYTPDYQKAEIRWSSLSARRIGAELLSLAQAAFETRPSVKPGEGEWPSPEGDLGSDVR